MEAAPGDGDGAGPSAATIDTAEIATIASASIVALLAILPAIASAALNS